MSLATGVSFVLGVTVARVDALSSASGQPLRPTPFVMPATFDAATVQKLLDTVEQGRNATILKVGYFMRRGQPSLAVPQGFALLKASLAKETVGTRRWFVLQQLRAWAAFHNPGLEAQEGVDAYNALFDQAGAATTITTRYSLDQSIRECLINMTSHSTQWALIDDKLISDVLFKAWRAYITYLRPAPQRQALVSDESPPHWIEAIARAGLQKEFVAQVDQVLADNAIPKTYGLLMTAANILHPTQPERAVELLQKAKPLLPLADEREASAFYSNLVDWLADVSRHQDGTVDKIKMAAAIETQQEVIQRTGRGQARLLLLYAFAQDQVSFNRTMAQLETPNANEQEINEAVDRMLAVTPQERARPMVEDKPEALLTQYLRITRQRDVEQELHARYMLGYILLYNKKPVAAQAALAVEHIKLPLPTATAQRYYTQIQQMLKQLDTPKDAGQSH